jgi:hypothetical protein
MALSAIQKQAITEQVLYQTLINMAGSLNTKMVQINDQLEILNLISATDLDEMVAGGVPPAIQTLLSDFRVELNIFSTAYTSGLSAIVDQLRGL